MEKSLNKDILIIPLTQRYDCSSFCCTNAELNEFLKNNALLDQAHMTSRTYLCCWKKQTAGYFTLVADTLEVQAVDQSDTIEGYLYRKYPAIKIARLAVDHSLERNGIGRFILLAAIGKAINVSNDIGCRYITVDSKPESMGFYEKHNFKVVEKYRYSEFPKMYLNMYPIVAAMRPKENLKEFEER
ncbi:Acetyltransferase (GNAT) domain protein [uncultured archaeon]|nr:Acetyltransferase (GNAT) domain protein [uncultured archaeon]